MPYGRLLQCFATTYGVTLQVTLDIKSIFQKASRHTEINTSSYLCNLELRGEQHVSDWQQN